MADTQQHDHKHQAGRAYVALFRSRAEAREAIAALHKAHYTHTWLGVTSLAQTDGGEEAMTVESLVGGFFSGTQSLVDALVSHGVLGDTARELEGTIEPGDALVTLDVKEKDPAQALALIAEHGGSVSGRFAHDGTDRPARRIETDVRGGEPWEEEMFFRRPQIGR